MADQTALDVLSGIIDSLAGEHVDIPDTLVPALLVLAGYIQSLSEDMAADVAAYLEAHPELTTTVQDGSITKAKFADGVFDALTSAQVDALF